MDHVHVQVLQVLVHLEGVHDLGEQGAQAGDRRLLVGLQEAGAGAAIAGADQGDLVAAGDQPSTSQWTMASMPP